MSTHAKEERLNILLVTVDQWRGRMFGLETPNLQRLAAEGVRFARHFCQAYPCGPARASLLTGLYAHKHRSIQNGVPLDARHPTLFSELRRAGYRPVLFGYTDTTHDPRGLHPNDPDRGIFENVAPGLDVGLHLTEEAGPWLAHLKKRGHAAIDAGNGRHGVFAQRPFPAPAAFAAADSETAFLTDRFLDWLGVADEPWCAHLSYIAPHPPFSAASPFHAMFDPADMPDPLRGGTPATEAAQHPLIAGLIEACELADFVPGLAGRAHAADERVRRQVQAIYLGQAAEVDHHLGRILDALREKDALGRTLIVFTGDHGEQLFDHWLLGKTGYYDQSAHIPLLIRDPRPPAAATRGRVVQAFTEAIDVMPTLLAAAGLTLPRNLDGHDLAPLLAGELPAGWRDAVHWSFDFRDIVDRRFERAFGLPSEWCNLQVMRTDSCKYVHFAAMPPVLFDLAQDPGEMSNLAADRARIGLRSEAMDRLLSWRQRHEERTLTGFLARDGVLHEDAAPHDLPHHHLLG